MRKYIVSGLLIVSCSLGAYFLGTALAESRTAGVPLPKKEVILSEIEAKYAENPENIFEIVAETRALLSGNTKTQSEIARARIRLDRAVDAFYRKHLDTVTLGLLQKNGLEKYKKSYESLSKEDPKLGLGAKSRMSLRESITRESTIDPTSQSFESYVYITGRSGTGGLTLSEATQTGSLSKETMQLMIRAEKWQFAGTGVVLSKEDTRDIFSKYQLRPWSQWDLRQMRRTITSESLGQETRYTRAYLTAVDLFRDRLTTRIYLRDTLKHSKQKESLSCEANSISNLFNYYRDKTKSPRISETEVFRIMPKDEKLPESIDTDSGAVRIWGDPDTHFVGRVEGKQSSNPNKLTGYGIHPKWALPMIRDELTPRGYTANIEPLNEFNILWSLYESHPVLMWYVYSDDPKKGFAQLEWDTWAGQPRTGYVGEHTGLIVGAELSKNGDLLKVGYYEWRSENIIWEDWETLKRKAQYFEGGVFVEKITK